MSDIGYKTEMISGKDICWGLAGEGEAFLAGGKRVQNVRGLLTIGAGAIVAAIVFPAAGHLLDALWVLSLCLTAAVFVISLFAREAVQVQGFPSLVVLVTALNIVVGAASAKLILLEGKAGSIVSFTGHLVVRSNSAMLYILFGIGTVVVFRIIRRAVGRISRAGMEYSSDIMTYKVLSIYNDLASGLINHERAFQLRGKAAGEGGFFTAMASVAGFMLCAAIIEVAIVIFNSTGAFISGSSGSIQAMLSMGAEVMMLTCLVVTVLASKHLVGKSFAAFSAEVGLERLEKRDAEAVAAESQAGECQVSRMDCVEPSEHLDVGFPPDSEDYGLEFRLARASLGGLADAVCAEFTEISDNGQDSESGKSVQDFETSKADRGKGSYHKGDYYAAIIELIESEPVDDSGTTRTILMGAWHVAELAVTIPVNVGMRLAQQGLRCLLVDVDSKRDAIAKVFDVEDGSYDQIRQGHGEESQRNFGISTCITNLRVLPAKSFCDGERGVDMMCVREAIAAVQDRYDRIIIYAPNMKRLRKLAGAGGCIDEAVMFGDEGLRSASNGEADIERVLAGFGCKVLKAPVASGEGFCGYCGVPKPRAES